MFKDTISREQLIQYVQHIEQTDFEKVALQVFQYQAIHNPIYQSYIQYLNVDISTVQSIKDIPFLPIDLFKRFEIKTGEWSAEAIFGSSGTTGSVRSNHHIRSTDLYLKIAQKGFEQQYGALKNFCILALLPSYLERQDSSLVAMVNHFIQESGHPHNGFYLDNLEALKNKLVQLKQQNQLCLLIGVSFALLDFAEHFPMDLSNIIVMETGGMKGRRKEMTRATLHAVFKKCFQVNNVHSEYGMTELLSQGYSKGNGIFKPIQTMKILIRELNDPFSYQKNGKKGGVNIIDLANLDSCAFIETEDIGKVYDDESFEILGRIDHSAIRGCNLMVSDL